MISQMTNHLIANHTPYEPNTKHYINRPMDKRHHYMAWPLCSYDMGHLLQPSI